MSVLLERRTNASAGAESQYEVIAVRESLSSLPSWGSRSVKLDFEAAAEKQIRPDPKSIAGALVFVCAFMVMGPVVSLAGISRTFGDQSAIPADTWDERWALSNMRRVHLIRKDLSAGLSADEKLELDRLEEEAEQYANAVAPVSLDSLKQFEEAARRAAALGPDGASRP